MMIKELYKISARLVKSNGGYTVFVGLVMERAYYACVTCSEEKNLRDPQRGLKSGMKYNYTSITH